MQELTFDAMNLQVGVRLQFISHRGIKPVQFFSSLIGYVKDEYLIVKIPTDSGAPIPLDTGEKVSIRVFSGLTVCMFACTVERVFARPLNYVHLSFPTAIQGASLREAMRVKVDLPAQIRPQGSSAAPQDVCIANISVSGALIESPRQLPPDLSRIELSFSLNAPPDNQKMLITTQADIRNTSMLPASAERRAVYTYGVRFVNLEPLHFTLLQAMTYEAVVIDRLKIV